MKKMNKTGVKIYHCAVHYVQLRHELFESGMGTLCGTTAKIHVKDGLVPKFLRARSVPYMMQGKIEREVERMQMENILEAVKFSEWATPIVPVMKLMELRICGDYKVMVNRESHVEQYPIPMLEDIGLLVKLGKRNLFSKLDMSHAYNQMMLDEESQNILTINTHKGLFRSNLWHFLMAFLRHLLFFGGRWSLVSHIPGVCYLDNILITGKTEVEHLDILHQVL